MRSTSRRQPVGLRGRVPASVSRSPQSGTWTVALPAWGERYVGIATKSTLPALLAALAQGSWPARIVVWTDAPERFAVFGSIVECRPVPGPDNAFGSLSACHQEIMDQSEPGTAIVLLTADMVISRELLATCAAKIASGTRCVCCVPPRTVESGALPPVGASGRELLAWAWENRHRMTRECTWPEGRSYDVWRMYFQTGDEVAARVFLPHPVVVVTDGRRLHFSPTIDVNLTNNFSTREVYLITQPEEGACIEVSPSDKDFVMTEPMSARAGAGMGVPGNPPFVRCGNARHRMFFEKRVVFCGAGVVDDAEVVRRMLG